MTKTAEEQYEAHAHRYAGEEPAHTAFRDGYMAGHEDGAGGDLELKVGDAVLVSLDELDPGLAELARAEAATEAVHLWWLSFCDPELPEGSQFMGACMVPGRGFANAVRVAHALGLNPGGECQGHPVDPARVQEVPNRWLFRRLSRAECEAFDREILSRRREVVFARPGGEYVPEVVGRVEVRLRDEPCGLAIVAAEAGERVHRAVTEALALAVEEAERRGPECWQRVARSTLADAGKNCGVTFDVKFEPWKTDERRFEL